VELVSLTFVFEDLCNIRSALLQKIEFSFGDGSVSPIFEYLEHKFFWHKKLVDLLLWWYWSGLPDLVGHLLLIFTNWWSCSMLDEQLLDMIFVMSYCKLDWGMVSVVFVVNINALHQQPLNDLNSVRFDCIIQWSLLVIINMVKIGTKCTQQ
jgi:hypothetical protein